MFGDSKHIDKMLLKIELQKEVWKNQKKIDYLNNKDKTQYCENCDKIYKYHSYKNHLKTKKHKLNINKL